MSDRKGPLIGVAALALVAIVLAAVPFLTTITAPSVEPTKRIIYMAAIEPKGGTTTDKEPFPTKPLPAGDGYALKPPDKTGRWEVSSYRWEPGTIVVNQGDSVTLEILGINGAEHPSIIEGYNINFNVKRGQITTVNFIADKAGVFRIVCSTHVPSMVAELVVLRR